MTNRTATVAIGASHSAVGRPARTAGLEGFGIPSASELGSVTIRRARYQVIADLGPALLEAYTVSLGSQRRAVHVLSLAEYFGGQRAGYVVVERPPGDLFGAVVAIVVAV
jgi:hypothetical protein